MDDSVRHYLIVYNSETRSVEVEDIGADSDKAVARYAELEEKYGGSTEYEVVLISADSLETIKTTHAHYFEGDKGSSIELRLATSV